MSKAEYPEHPGATCWCHECIMQQLAAQAQSTQGLAGLQQALANPQQGFGQAAQAQQLGQQGLQTSIRSHELRIMNREDSLYCRHCGVEVSGECLKAAGFVMRGQRDRDGMLLADRLQVLADENVTLLAENARLRREKEAIEKRLWKWGEKR